MHLQRTDMVDMLQNGMENKTQTRAANKYICKLLSVSTRSLPAPTLLSLCQKKNNQKTQIEEQR